MTKWQEWQEICRIPKWAKISLVVFSALVIMLLAGAFALQKWAGSQVESASLVFSKVDKNKSAELESKIESSAESKSESNAKSQIYTQIYAYEARVHFTRLDFLLRSGSISRIDLQSIVWANGIDSSAIKSVETHNRRLNFTTTQNLALNSGANLGTMSFKMDFSPLPKGIAKYYVLIMIFASVVLFFYNVFKNEIARFLNMLNKDSLPQALWSGYKNINPLYRHTFWIVFIACNVVFGFHTIHFLWGNHDWWGVMFYNDIWSQVYEGRYTNGIISGFIQSKQLLPILNNAISFAFLAFASVWLCIYLNIQRKLWIWVSIGLLLTLQPFTLAKMYYAYQITGDFFAVAIGFLGFILAKKAGETSPNHLNNSGVSNSLSLSLSRSRVKSYALCFLSIICIHWGHC
ncbi:glucosyltransferase domain-containing protein [Helicobacter sp. T3_23-1059]